MDIVWPELCAFEPLRQNDIRVNVEESETLGHDPDDFAGPRVDRHTASYDSRIARQSSLPIPVAQDHGFGRSRRIVCRRKPPPDRGPHTYGSKGGVRHDHGTDLLGLSD